MRLLALCALAACLAAADVPAWVNDRPVEDGTLFGVGQAADAADSQAKAKADISGQLLSSVSSHSTSQQSQKLEKTNDATVKETKSSFDMKTAVSTQAKFLPGAEVAAQVTAGGTVYTLVKLNKAAFIKAAQARIAELDKPLGKLAGADPDPITGARITALRRGVPLAEERDALALTIAGQGEAVADTPVAGDDLKARLGLLLEPGTVALKHADKAPSCRDAVLDVLDGLGLAAADKADEARFELRLTEKSRMQKTPNGWQKCEITGAVTVARLDTGEVIGSLEAKAVKTDATGSEEGAKSKARDELIKTLGNELNTRLLPILIRGKSD
jgi:hypothetical protein